MSRLTWVRNQEIQFGFGYRTVTFCGPTFQTVHLPNLFSRVIPIAPRNPERTRVRSVWAVPRSLATTDGITDCFLFLRVLRCFTSPGSPPATMDSSQAMAVLPAMGFPIRKSTDQSLVSSSPWLIAATHVLRRLLEPRHPPHALSSLVTLDSSLPRNSRTAKPRQGQGPSPSAAWTSKDLAASMHFYPSYSVVRELELSPAKTSARTAGTRGPGVELGGADRSRTDDIQLAKLALYQLSYSPKSNAGVGSGGPRWI